MPVLARILLSANVLPSAFFLLASPASLSPLPSSPTSFHTLCSPSVPLPPSPRLSPLQSISSTAVISLPAASVHGSPIPAFHLLALPLACACLLSSILSSAQAACVAVWVFNANLAERRHGKGLEGSSGPPSGPKVGLTEQPKAGELPAEPITDPLSPRLCRYMRQCEQYARQSGAAFNPEVVKQYYKQMQQYMQQKQQQMPGGNRPPPPMGMMGRGRSRGGRMRGRRDMY